MTIKYKLAELNSSATKKGTSYIGQIVHNHTLDMAEMAKRYASKFHQTETAAQFNLSSVAEYIAYEMAEGNRLNFGPFSVGIKMCGRITEANTPYDRAKNPLKVTMTAGTALNAAANQLEPVCETTRTKPWISNIIHHHGQEPTVADYDIIRLDGNLITMNAYHCKVDQTREDEGVWLASADGKTLLLKAEIRENTAATCDVVFRPADLLGGEYRIVIRSRGKPENPIVVASRKVTVVADEK